MKTRPVLPQILLLFSLALAPAWCRAEAVDQVFGKFQSDRMSIDLVDAGNGKVTGTIHYDNNQFPLEGRLGAAQVQGTFTSQGFQYTFTAHIQRDELSLVTGGVTHLLKRQTTAPANPLAVSGVAAPPPNPIGQPPPEPAQTVADTVARREPIGGSLAGYDVLAAQGVGRTLFTLKPGLRSAKEGVLAALRDLRSTFDDKPAVSGAFGDGNDKQCHGSFTAKLKGQPAKGLVLCGVGDNGAAITIVYHRADAPVQEVANLMGALPTSTQWVEHPLAGGSGTLRLPADWKITSSSALGSVAASGPSGQVIGLGIGLQVTNPNSFLAAQARASGTMLVAPFSDPVTAVKNLSPQLSVMSQRQGGPAITLNRIITNSPAAAQIPGGQAAWVYSASTKGSGQQAVPVRELALIECYPVGPLGWGIYTSFASAPDATFDRELPIMMQIAQSWKLNDRAVMDNSRAMINAQNQRFAAFQQSMKEKNEAFDRYMASVRNNERVRERSNTDFDEMIRGYRTVEDTTTGYRKDVDLGYSKEIVDKLNEKEGYQRYKEIPLRDQ